MVWALKESCRRLSMVAFSLSEVCCDNAKGTRLGGFGVAAVQFEGTAVSTAQLFARARCNASCAISHGVHAVVNHGVSCGPRRWKRLCPG